MRHASDQDLDQLEGLLVELRELQPLRERKRGSFSRGSKAFLHFHADGDNFYVDVRFDAAFERMRITTLEDRAAFLAAVRTTLQLTPE
jgi:hypothetical protein